MASFDKETGLEFLRSAKFADFTIKCGEASFAVHKVILHPKSHFFKACIDGSFQEGQESTITIHEAQPLAVAFLILYIYIKEFEIHEVKTAWPWLELPKELVQSSGSECFAAVARDYQLFIDYHCQAYELGVRYLMFDLQKFTAARVLRSLRKSLRTIARAQTPSKDLTGHAGSILSSIYSCTPDDDTVLRAAATTECIRCYKTVEAHVAVVNVILEHDAYAWNIGTMVVKEAHVEIDRTQRGRRLRSPSTYSTD